MIYSPREVFDLRAAILAGIVKALVSAAADFLAEDNKPWEYYVGVGFGGTVAATGIPGASATVYVVGTGVDLLLFKSPDGSSVDLFLDGVLSTTVDAFTDDLPEWFTVGVAFAPGVLHRIDIVNNVNENPAKESPINWLAIGDIEVLGSGAYAQGKSSPMSLYNISYSLLDDDGDVDTFAMKVIASTHTIAQIQEAAQDFALLLDEVTGAQITGIAVTLEASLPGGLKSSPVATIENQKGATLSFTLDGSSYRDSLRIPAVKVGLFAGKNLNTSDTDVTALITAITDGITVTAGGGATVEPANRFEYEYSALASAVKSFRK